MHESDSVFCQKRGLEQEKNVGLLGARCSDGFNLIHKSDSARQTCPILDSLLKRAQARSNPARICFLQEGLKKLELLTIWLVHFFKISKACQVLGSNILKGQTSGQARAQFSRPKPNTSSRKKS